MPGTQLRISRVAVAHPEYRISQDEAAREIGERSGDPRRVQALARGTQIEGRAIALPAEELARLGTTAERNEVYRRVAPRIALDAARGALGEAPPGALGCLVTSSCTGYMSPGWALTIVRECGLNGDVVRLPITEAGCAGGALGLARAADYLHAHEDRAALVVAAELCSLAFHAGGGDGNLTSTLIFGDGAGAALIERGDGPGLQIMDSASALIPDSEAALGFALTDTGFYPLLARELVEILPGPTVLAIDGLLRRHGLDRGDISAWLLHPGGARILRALEQALDTERIRMRWSWDAMREYGNTSSAAIFDVLSRYMADAAPGEWAVAAAFGPGVSVELLLLRAC